MDWLQADMAGGAILLMPTPFDPKRDRLTLVTEAMSYTLTAFQDDGVSVWDIASAVMPSRVVAQSVSAIFLNTQSFNPLQLLASVGRENSVQQWDPMFSTGVPSLILRTVQKLGVPRRFSLRSYWFKSSSPW
ncbi:hypothetical protein [Mesorhizobium sangaii]|uniref:Uncharacterized protein n=1 Tax=Mesorhizobium sangaii TaxID=505389 RepID=A0A841PUW5_9HYPH|nr:hypothetical protein [Mesorhizobium sangaii]MBB6413842.1 hypothetical protein [Mesorhizobium sangaii]